MPFRLRTYPLAFCESESGPRLRGFVRTTLLADKPEERVRQNVLRTLVDVYGYPEPTLLVEEPVARGTANRTRADVLVELPRAAVQGHSVVLTAPEAPGADPPYTARLAGLREQIELSGSTSLVSVPDVPDALAVDVDGSEVTGRCLGFKARRDGIELFLDPGTTPGLPARLRFRVVGYGMSPKEAALARQLGLPPVLPDHGVAATLGGLDLQLWVAKKLFLRGFVTEKAEDAWGVVHLPHDTEFGALVHLDLNGDQRNDLLLQTIEGLPSYATDDGRTAHRERLDDLATGDRVVVAFTDPDEDWASGEGVVVETLVESVGVDLDDGERVMAHRRIDIGEPWLAGRVDAPVDTAPTPPAASGGKSDDTRTLIVIECKAPGVLLTKEVREQGLRYARTRSARYLVLTNGTDSDVYRVTGTGRHQEIGDIPDYETAVSNREYEVERVETSEPEAILPETPPAPDALRLFARACNIGCDVPEALYLPVARLIDLVRDRRGSLLAAPRSSYGITLREDLGVHYHAPESADGGAAAAYYRDFLVKDANGHDLVVGFAVTRESRIIGDPRYGTHPGRSCLKVGIADSADYRMALSAYLDGRTLRDVVPGRRLSDTAGFGLWHSGTATAGRSRVSSADTQVFLKARSPELVGDHGVFLGLVPTQRPTADQSLDVIHRLLAYATHRDELKKQRRGGKERARRVT